MAACKCPRLKITISCNFQNLRKHLLDPTDYPDAPENKVSENNTA